VSKEPSYSTFNTADPAFPVLIAVPHAGRDYPLELLSALRVDPAELVRLEDRYADRLAQRAIEAGVPAIIMRKARAWIDLNRAEDDYDAAMFSAGGSLAKPQCSAKTRGGLGLVPRRLHGCGELWKQQFEADDLAARIEHEHRPYHLAVDSTLAAMRDRFGSALLIDLHSMPSLLPGSYNPPPRCVVGDRFGQSAAGHVSEMLIESVLREGIPCVLNSPYPGDFTLRRHGQVRRNIHAVQLEFDRSLYLDEAQREPTAALPLLSDLVMRMALDMADMLRGSYWAEAAE
jgi:N-formylglutamate amidohydrolase